MKNDIFDSIKIVADEKERQIMLIRDRRERFLKLRDLVSVLRSFRADAEAEKEGTWTQKNY